MSRSSASAVGHQQLLPQCWSKNVLGPRQRSSTGTTLWLFLIHKVPFFPFSVFAPASSSGVFFYLL